MKVIFLDVDGVLNADWSDRKNGPLICGWTGIETVLVKKLRQIVEATDAKIVLVSSWKDCYENWNKHRRGLDLNIDYTFEDDRVGKYLYNKLSKEHLHILDTTFKFERTKYDRGKGIVSYIEAYNSTHTVPITNFVILDDEIFDDYVEYKLYDNLVKTKFSTGLTDQDVEKAIKILGE